MPILAKNAKQLYGLRCWDRDPDTNRKDPTMIIDAHPTTTFVAICAPCVRPVTATITTATGPRTYIRCPQCGNDLRADRLMATTNTSEPCDTRCMGATGPACSCACGGDNHAGAFRTFAGEITETALAEYRARQDRKEREATRRRDAERNRAHASFTAWVNAGNADVAEFLADADNALSSDFLWDMSRLVVAHRPLTDRQADAVRRCMAAAEKRASQDAEYEAQAKPVPTGKGVTVTGTIITIRVEDSPFAYNRTTSKMLVRCDGYKVWCTAPKSLTPVTYAGVIWDLKGRTVEFVADVTASKDDDRFGFASRPRQARYVDGKPAPGVKANVGAA